MGDTEQEDFQMTHDEMDRLTKAMKDKEFCKLFYEYANEISDPANKKKYEEEIIAMEKQRGQDVRFLKPQSGFVIKTVRLSDNMKVFLNICTSPEVAEYTLKNVKGKSQVSLPHSLSPERDDIDKAGKPCIVYDVCFNPKSYEIAIKEEGFRETLIESAFDTIEHRLTVKLDRINKKFPKMSYKGLARPLLLRSEKGSNNNTTMSSKNGNAINFPYPKQNATSKSTKLPSSETKASIPVTKKSVDPVVPKYKMVHRGYFEMTNYTNGRSNSTTTPKELVVEIELPLVKSANGLNLDIFEKQLVLKSENPSYHLDISLPHKVDEERGKAQFDKSKKVLSVTLPVLESETTLNDSLNYLPSPPLVEECSPLSDEDLKSHVTNGNLSNGHSKNEEKTSNEPINAMFNNYVNGHDVKPNEVQSEMHSNTHDDGFQTLEMEDLENAEFDTKVLESLPVNSQLPPYSYEQTEEKVVVVVNVTNIKVQHLSLGFTLQQVCLSFPQNVDDTYSPDWNMIIRLDDKYFLDKDECGFEIFEDRLELYLRKKNFELWDRFFIGVSETSLKMELFMRESVASDILDKLQSLNVNKLPRATGNATEEERKAIGLESRLEQLLICQEKQRTLDLVKQQQEEEKESISDDDNDEAFLTDDDKKNQGQSPDGSYYDLKVNLMDLADDVIDENSPLISPSSTTNSCTEGSREYRLLERSMSHDPYQNPRLRSILKRSKSDGANSSGCDTDDDVVYQRTRATTYSNRKNVYSEPEDSFRRRHKSVSFLDEPIVFEFTKLSKRQWKRQLKEEKQRDLMGKKHKDKTLIQSELTTTTTTAASSTDDDKANKPEKQDKHGRKWRKAEKKRNRNNSESQTEEECERGPSKMKGKRKKKNKKGGNLNFITTTTTTKTNSGSDSMGRSEGRTKPSLNNPLIFELD